MPDTRIVLTQFHRFDIKRPRRSQRQIAPGDPLALYVTLTEARAISGLGWIAATGFDDRTDTTHAYLFSTTPVPLPDAAWLLLSGLGVLGVTARRRPRLRWRRSVLRRPQPNSGQVRPDRRPGRCRLPGVSMHARHALSDGRAPMTS